MDIYEKKAITYRANMVRIMKEHGFFDSVMEGSKELDRMKEFLNRLELASDSDYTTIEQQRDKSRPCPRLMPLFPGINNKIFHDIKDFPATRTLEENYDIIREEALALDEKQDFFDYKIREMEKNNWQIHLFSYMGNTIEQNCNTCPRTSEILNNLPNRCQIYPWGDALFSVLKPGAHIPAHYSLDNLRVRCMYGIIVPDGCVMRVAHEKTNWQEGKVMLFEDSFEHEVWHAGSTRRTVLILDFWHPDLTELEIEVLTIGLSYPLIRDELYAYLSNDSDEYSKYLATTFQQNKAKASFKKFWLNEMVAY